MSASFAIVGCGKVGKALGKFLVAAGYDVAGVSSKSLSSAREAAKLLRTDRCSDVPWKITPAADVVLITTPDGAIADTCGRIAENRGFKTGAVVLHCSGALPSTILAPARDCGAFTGSMHPLQSFASDLFDRNPFEGIIMAVEGEPKALVIATQMANDLGAVCLAIKTEGKTLYHAAAVAASNYLVTLMSMAFKLLDAAGISGASAFDVLKPLIDGTLANIKAVGIPQALTGPIARGDVVTVKNHLSEIASRTPELMELFKTLSRYTIDIARAKGSLSEINAELLKDVLSAYR